MVNFAKILAFIGGFSFLIEGCTKMSAHMVFEVKRREEVTSSKVAADSPPLTSQFPTRSLS
jgi:hypothetical protein